MPYRPPLAHHPRAALLFSLLIALLVFGWAEPWFTGEPRRWPWVITASLLMTLITYLIRTRSARFMAYMVIGVSIAALAVYGVITFQHGMPANSTQRLAWLSIFALPIVGLAFGAWVLQRPPKRT